MIRWCSKKKKDPVGPPCCLFLSVFVVELSKSFRRLYNRFPWYASSERRRQALSPMSCARRWLCSPPWQPNKGSVTPSRKLSFFNLQCYPKTASKRLPWCVICRPYGHASVETLIVYLVHMNTTVVVRKWAAKWVWCVMARSLFVLMCLTYPSLVLDPVWNIILFGKYIHI